MKSIISALALLALSLPLAAQTTVAPVVVNGVATYTYKDVNGNTVSMAVPVPTAPSAVVNYTAAPPPVVVTPPPPPPPPPPTSSIAPTIPSNAIKVSLITGGSWKAPEHDAGTPGSGSGTNNYPVTGIFADSARAFSMVYANGGGVRWANSLAKDVTSTNFVLDGVFQSPDWTHVADLELDTNVVKSDGKTAILGTQCASQEKTWDVTLLASSGKWHWLATNVACNPMTWTPNEPHHVRIFGTISSKDVSTYLGVEFDGVYSPFSTSFTGPTGDALRWSTGTVLTNVQIDGYKTSGSATIYSDQLNIYRW